MLERERRDAELLHRRDHLGSPEELIEFVGGHGATLPTRPAAPPSETRPGDASRITDARRDRSAVLVLELPEPVSLDLTHPKEMPHGYAHTRRRAELARS